MNYLLYRINLKLSIALEIECWNPGLGKQASGSLGTVKFQIKISYMVLFKKRRVLIASFKTPPLYKGTGSANHSQQKEGWYRKKSLRKASRAPSL